MDYFITLCICLIFMNLITTESTVSSTIDSGIKKTYETIL